MAKGGPLKQNVRYPACALHWQISAAFVQRSGTESVWLCRRGSAVRGCWSRQSADPYSHGSRN